MDALFAALLTLNTLSTQEGPVKPLISVSKETLVDIRVVAHHATKTPSGRIVGGTTLVVHSETIEVAQ